MLVHTQDQPDPNKRARSTKQRCKAADGEENFLAARAKITLDMQCLQTELHAQAEAAEEAADIAALAEQAERRRARGGFSPRSNHGLAPVGLAGPPAAAVRGLPDLDGAAQRAVMVARAALLANGDLRHLPQALRMYYYPEAEGPQQRLGSLPEKVSIVQSGCIAAQLMHHPQDIDRSTRPHASLPQ